MGHASFLAMIYSPLGEYRGKMAKFGHLAKSEICASLRGLNDKFLAPLDIVLSGADETGVEDGVVAIVVGVEKVGSGIRTVSH